MPSPRVPLSRHLLRVRDLIDRDYGEPLDTKALAGSAYVTEAHFIREFRKRFGETPHRYLLSRRMERAMQLLRDTDRPVTEICLTVGFTSLGSFSTQFRRFVGESPSSYRGRPRGEDLATLPSCVVQLFSRPTP
ncbi:AraC family transcriptional regulator [Sinomonas sp. JGH33]|uniref:AraC family transcriptional regulator n=1 Tax=Sinomonas terricola TaxID=3110330 RepID=A0ABU5T4F6_9MICC|nr:AraC family transcriptional regulator [Sinomonas sp. JGH33]MEA5454026.1 AraC family transcriptional regulator [Sinomonas sp. JGH33]